MKRWECWEKKEKEESEKGEEREERGEGRVAWQHVLGPVWNYYGKEKLVVSGNKPPYLCIFAPSVKSSLAGPRLSA